jgi:hypothetical protein
MHSFPDRNWIRSRYSIIKKSGCLDVRGYRDFPKKKSGVYMDIVKVRLTEWESVFVGTN